MDVPQSALPSLVDALLLEAAPPLRPPRPSLPPEDRSTPIGRAVAAFYRAIEFVDESDRAREAAQWRARQDALLEWRNELLDPTTSELELEQFHQLAEPDGRAAPTTGIYVTFSTGILTVENIRRHTRSDLRAAAGTAARAAELFGHPTGGCDAGLSSAVTRAFRREVLTITDNAVQAIHEQTRLILRLDEATATTTIDDWLSRHGLTTAR